PRQSRAPAPLPGIASTMGPMERATRPRCHLRRLARVRPRNPGAPRPRLRLPDDRAGGTSDPRRTIRPALPHDDHGRPTEADPIGAPSGPGTPDGRLDTGRGGSVYACGNGEAGLVGRIRRTVAE